MWALANVISISPDGLRCKQQIASVRKPCVVSASKTALKSAKTPELKYAIHGRLGVTFFG